MKSHSPAWPINKKNHTLPVTLHNNGIAYAGLLNRSTTAQNTPNIFLLTQLFRRSVTDGRDFGV